MKKIFLNILCCFIPSKIMRQKVRKKIQNSNIQLIKNNVAYKNDFAILNSYFYFRHIQKLDNNVSFFGNNIVEEGVTIGKCSYFSHYTRICKTKLGKYCSVAHNCTIGATRHPTDWLSTSPFQFSHWLIPDVKIQNFETAFETEIGNDVWIGANVVIRDGIKIGNGAIIAAGSIVVKNVPDYAIVAGVPAAIKKYRFDKVTIDKLLRLKWWDLDESLIKKLPFNDIKRCIELLELSNKK